mgnify:CR=1 FL=1
MDDAVADMDAGDGIIHDYDILNLLRDSGLSTL